MGRTLTPAITKPLRWNLVANQPVPTTATTWITPNGMLNRMVSKLEYPNDLTMRLPKFPMPPLAMLYHNVSLVSFLLI